MFLLGLGLGTFAATGSYFTANEIKKQYPPKQQLAQPGTEIHVAEIGKRLIVVGYAGHTQHQEGKLSTKQDVYYGPVEVAVDYANRNARGLCPEGKKAVPAVFPILAKKLPKHEDLGMQAFEGGFSPISPEGCANIGVIFGKAIPVTQDMNPGLMASVERMMAEWKKNKS